LMAASSFMGGLLLVVTYFISEPENASVTETVLIEPASHEMSATNKIKPLLKEKITSSVQKSKINRLLKTAKLHFMVGRLISPEGSNAFHAYQLVLKLEPANVTAQTAIVSIQDRILTHTEKLVEQGETERAKEQLILATSLFPNNQLLQALSKNMQ